MELTGYECNQCNHNFEDRDQCCDEVEIKCPSCGSIDVEQSDAASEFIELVQEMGRTGG